MNIVSHFCRQNGIQPWRMYPQPHLVALPRRNSRRGYGAQQSNSIYKTLRLFAFFWLPVVITLTYKHAAQQRGILPETTGMHLCRFPVKESPVKTCRKICRKTTMNRVFETIFLEATVLVIFPSETQMEASKSLKLLCGVWKEVILSYDCIIMITIIIIVVLAYKKCIAYMK